MNNFRFLAAALALSTLAGSAAAEPGRHDALKALIQALPAANPKADPTYWDVGGYTAEDALASCHVKKDEMDSMDRIIALIDRYENPPAEDAKLSRSQRMAQLMSSLSALPDFQGDEGRNGLTQLKRGLGIAPDFVKSSLVSRNCRAMLKFHYDNGASQAQLLGALEDADKGGKLDAEPAPKD